ncbi:hypothetical protein F5X96DRAFT_612793 [Biscogniauxia mediterranea]|nr:hypothetical protein F5X96DRAFT_612793 [Biscogniauxia mediterranea]
MSFALGDFIKVIEGAGSNFTFARINGIFIYQRTSSRWLFLVVTFTAPQTEFPMTDYLLKCPLYNLTENRTIIGLPRVCTEKVWMVPGPNRSLLFINHKIWCI